MTAVRVLVISSDLMVTSRLTALGRDCGATVRTRPAPVPAGDEEPIDLVLLDLQALPGDAAAVVGRARGLIAGLPPAAGGTTKLVAFGPHVAKQRLDDAVAAGADAALSRGEVLGAFPALIRQWCGPT